MPLIFVKHNEGRRVVLIILGPDNIERMQEKDPFEVHCRDLLGDVPINSITVAYATGAELTQIEELLRQGKRAEAMDLALTTVSGFRYRPERGDHDRGFQQL
jgi:hypothetical protein